MSRVPRREPPHRAKAQHEHTTECDVCGWPIHAAWRYVKGEPFLDYRHTSFPGRSYRGFILRPEAPHD